MKVGDKVKISKVFSYISWYVTDIFTITNITNDVDVEDYKIVEIDKRLNVSDYSYSHRISSFYLIPAIKEIRKEKLKKLLK